MLQNWSGYNLIVPTVFGIVVSSRTKWADYDSLSSDKQATIRSDLKELLFVYLLIKHISSTTNHDSIWNNLLESYITKQGKYPVDRSGAIAILNKYNKK